MRRCLCQAAWAVSMKHDNYLSALHRRLAARRRGKRTIVAVAHNVLGYKVTLEPLIQAVSKE